MNDLTKTEDEKEKVGNEYEAFERDIEVMDQFQGEMTKLFSDSKSFLDKMMTNAKRGGNVNLKFIADQTANISSIMSSKLAIQKAIMDAKQKRFANNLKVNPVVNEADSSVPYALVERLLDSIRIDSGSIREGEVIDVEAEKDIDDQIEALLELDEDGEPAKPEADQDLATEVVIETVLDSIDGDDESVELQDDFEVVVTEDGRLHIIDKYFNCFDADYELPEEEFEVFVSDSGDMFTEYQGETIRFIEKDFLIFPS